MSELANPVIPPSAKFAVAEPATPPADPSAANSNPPAEQPARTDKPDAVRSMSDRIEAVMRGEKSAAPAVTDKGASQDSPDPALNKEIEAETKGMGQKERAAWTKLRYENRDFARKVKEQETLTSKIAELEAKLAAAPNSTTPPPELEALKTRLDEAERLLAIKDVENTEDYKTNIAKPRAAIEDMARSLAAKYNVSEVDMLRALSDTSDKRSDLISEVASGMNDLDKYEFYNAARALKELGTKAEGYRVNAKEALARLSEQAQARVIQDTEAQATIRAAAHKDGWARMQESLPILTPAQGDDEVTKAWNAEIANAEKFAQTVNYSGLEIPVQAAVMQRAAVYPLLVGAVNSLQEALRAAQSEATKLRGSRPGAGGGVTPTERTAKSGPVDFVERVNERLTAQGI